MTKKLITLFTTATLVAVFLVQQIIFASPTASFNPADLSLTVSGSISTKAGVEYTVTVAQRSDATPQFSKLNPPLNISLFKTSWNGETSETISLQENLEGGEYTAYFAYSVNDVDYIDISHFSYTNPSEPATIELLNLLNGESSGEKAGATNADEFYDIISPRGCITKFGIKYDNVYDISKSVNKIPFMSDIAFSMRSLQPNGKFTFESLTEVLLQAEAAFDIKSDGLAITDIYSSYLGDYYSKIDKLTNDEQQKLNHLLKNANYKGMHLADLFTKKYIMSKVLCANTRLKIKSIITDYCTEIGINIDTNSDYSKILPEKMYIVYDGIIGEISDNTELSDIKQYFNKYVKKALEESQNTPSPSRPSSTPGSVISGNNLTNPNLSAVQPPEESTQVTVNFNDIASHFSKESVVSLANRGVISGYPNGNFEPNKYVSRAEFCKIISLAFKLDNSEIFEFSDVESNAWFAKYVYALAQSGIVTGYDNRFMPDNPITREDAAVIIQRLMSLKGANLTNNIIMKFNDANDISNYAISSVTALSGAQIISGDGFNFYPKNPITRGESAVLICNAEKVLTGGIE